MKTLSYILGVSLGLLAIYPLIGWQVPVIVNSFLWVYLVLFIGLLASLLLFTRLHPVLKILAFYLYASCFIAYIPYRAFNATILIIPAVYLFMLVKKLDIDVIVKITESIFLFQIVMMVAQLFGKDTLINFGHDKPVVFGTVMQNMRLGSLFCMLTPFLLIKSKWYFIPLFIIALWVKSAAFALALVVGSIVHLYLIRSEFKHWACVGLITGGIGYMLYDIESFTTAVGIGRIPRWLDIIYTGSHDTLASIPAKLLGPWDIKAMFFGRGLDSFMDLFPHFVHDPNPFGQAHNSFLQLWWETGLIGTGLVLAWLILLINKLYKRGENIYIVGMAIIAVNFFFAFPDRMFQTNILLLVFLAFCHWRVYGNNKQTVCS